MTEEDLARILRDHRARPEDHDLTPERIIDTLEEVVGRPASEEERYRAMLRSAFE